MPRKLSSYLKEIYGEKVYRISLSSGCTCPGRDGSIVLPNGEKLWTGCSFCSEGGSGDFAAKPAALELQIEEAKRRIAGKTDAGKFIAYFQSFTNTYGDVQRLRNLYIQTVQRDDVAILSLGTRPDCLGDDVMDMLAKLNAIKPVWIELGLQTVHEWSAENFHRGYGLEVFEDAYYRLKRANIAVIIHVILGLPGETREDMLETVRYISALNPAPDGVKLQNLQILTGTEMYEDYLGYLRDKDSGVPAEKTRQFNIMNMDEYTDLVAEALSILPEETVIHRMTGDGPRKLLVEPLWSLDKKRVLNMLTKKCGKLLE